MIQIKHKLQWPEFLAAQYLHMRPRRSLKWAGIVLLLFFATVLVIQWSDPQELETMDYVVSAFAVWMVLWFSVLLPLRARRIYRQNKLFHHETEGTIDDAGLHFQTDIGHSDIPWDHILKWKEGKKLILLYPSDAQFFIFPKRVLENGDLQAFLELLCNNVEKRMP